MCSLTKWCLTWKCKWSKRVTEFFPADKIAPIDIHRCLLSVNGDQTVDVSTVRRWVVRFSSGCVYEHGMQAHVHHWQKCTADGGDCWKTVFCSWEFAVSNNVIVLFVVVSVEINGRHYFRSDLCVTASHLVVVISWYQKYLLARLCVWGASCLVIAELSLKNVLLENLWQWREKCLDVSLPAV